MRCNRGKPSITNPEPVQWTVAATSSKSWLLPYKLFPREQFGTRVLYRPQRTAIYKSSQQPAGLLQPPVQKLVESLHFAPAGAKWLSSPISSCPKGAKHQPKLSSPLLQRTAAHPGGSSYSHTKSSRMGVNTSSTTPASWQITAWGTLQGSRTESPFFTILPTPSISKVKTPSAI